MECGLRVSAFLRVSVGAHVHAASARLAVIAQCLRKRRGVGGGDECSNIRRIQLRTYCRPHYPPISRQGKALGSQN